jgi:putative DNA primase/helicase
MTKLASSAAAVNPETPRRSTEIDWDNPNASNDNPPARPATSTPIWGPQEAAAAFKRLVAKFGPKDVLGVIPPDAETAKRLRDDRGKLPGYFNSNSPDTDPNGGAWIGRSKPLFGDEADTSIEEIKKWESDGAVAGMMTRNIHFFDNDGVDERITRGISAIIAEETGAVLARYGANSYRCSYPFLGSGLQKIRLVYWHKGMPKPEKLPALELLAVGQYTNVYGPHKSGILYTWRGGDFCDPDVTLQKLDIPTTDRVYAKVCAYLDAEGYEHEFTVGKKCAALHRSLCGAEPAGPAKASKGESAGKKSGNGNLRCGLDDDPSRHDEPGALRFMELVRNDAKRFPTRDSILPVIIALWTALGPNREDHYDRLLDWWLEYGGDNDDDGLRKILDSIKGGSSVGIDHLRARCPELALENAQELFADDPPPEYVHDAPPVAPLAADDAKPPAFSDDALALQFADLHAEDVRFAALWGKWFDWSGSHWRPDEKLHVMTLSRRVCRQVARRAVKELRMHLTSAGTIANVVRLARCDRRLAIAIDEFDRDPWLLNTPGGTVELKTGQMREHRRLDYLTKVAAVSPGGACPQWEAFIDRITGQDRELAAFIQRMLGYALTGSTQAQCLFFLFGRGANGKSVLISTVAGILGDGYHTTAPIETFTTSASDRHPTELAGLRGARLVTAIETEEGRKWAEAKIKNLTGGDKIAARFMRQDFFEYVPQFKLIVAGNHKPALLIVDEAIRRRFHLVPFRQTIPPEERDPNLTDKLKAEWPGILQWMIDGCLAWQRDGLNPPAAVREATKEYLEAEDALATWMAECGTPDPDAWVSRAALFVSWSVWARTAGEPTGSQRAFVHKPEDRLKPHRTANGRGFKGLKIRGNDTW